MITAVTQPFSLNTVVREARQRQTWLEKAARTVRPTAGMLRGVDFAWGGGLPTGGQVEADGFHFGVSYLSTDGTKCWTATQVSGYHRVGAGVVAVVEDGAGLLLGSFAAGQARARLAVEQARSLGWPGGRPLYWACDTDVTWAACASFMAGVRTVTSRAETGIYGGIRVITGAQASGQLSAFWQTLAWSGGSVASGIQLYQNGATATVGGQSCDVNEAYTLDYGQWYGVTPVPPPPAPPGPAAGRMIEDMPG